MSDEISKQLSWDGIEEWIQPLREEYLDTLTLLLKESQEKIKKKNLIEPAYTDWSKFRPLKTEYENDWSDWLAYLLEKSTTGYFAKELLGENAFLISPEKAIVERETPILGLSGGDKNFRTDILIHWLNKGRHIHIEVKIDDMNLDKTFPTSESVNNFIKEKYGNSPEQTVNHYILLSDYQMTEWEKVVKENTRRNISITPITWNKVADSLRKTLSSNDTQSKESNEWNVWANSFLGCIEQKLLKFEPFNQKLPLHGITKLINYHNKLLENKNMSDSTKEELDFLIKGVSIYSQAKHSISHFEDLVKKRTNAFFATNYWTQYADLEKLFNTSYQKIYSLDYIEYYFEFNFDKKKIIDLQIHFLSNPAMFVTRIFIETDKRNSIQLKAPENFKDIKVIKDPYGYYFKLVPDLTESFNLEKYLDILMEATLAYEGYVKNPIKHNPS
jgi:hypothetical protein